MQHVVPGLGVSKKEDLGAAVRVVLVGGGKGGGWYCQACEVRGTKPPVFASVLRQQCTHTCTSTCKYLLSRLLLVHHGLLIPARPPSPAPHAVHTPSPIRTPSPIPPAASPPLLPFGGQLLLLLLVLLILPLVVVWGLDGFMSRLCGSGQGKPGRSGEG